MPGPFLYTETVPRTLEMHGQALHPTDSKGAKLKLKKPETLIDSLHLSEILADKSGSDSHARLTPVCEK